MTVESFLDTNILIYAASRNPAETMKKRVAVELIETANFGLSGQVMQEFYTTATRKAQPRLRPKDALEWIEYLEEFPCAPITSGIVKSGAVLSEEYRISYWDGAIIAAAQALGAAILYSEDLNDGQFYGDVRVINPFRSAAPLSGFNEPANRF